MNDKKKHSMLMCCKDKEKQSIVSRKTKRNIDGDQDKHLNDYCANNANSAIKSGSKYNADLNKLLTQMQTLVALMPKEQLYLVFFNLESLQGSLFMLSGP